MLVASLEMVLHVKADAPASNGSGKRLAHSERPTCQHVCAAMSRGSDSASVHTAGGFKSCSAQRIWMSAADRPRPGLSDWSARATIDQISRVRPLQDIVPCEWAHQ